mgnify:FL=1
MKNGRLILALRNGTAIFLLMQKKKSINFFRNLINYKIRLSIRKQWNISLSDRKCWCVCAQKGKMKYDFSD